MDYKIQSLNINSLPPDLQQRWKNFAEILTVGWKRRLKDEKTELMNEIEMATREG